MLLAAVVVDAAARCLARPLHWLYYFDKLNQYITSYEDTPELFHTNKVPYYCLETGNTIIFGISQSVLESLVTLDKFDFDAVCVSIKKYFKPGNSNGYDLDGKLEYLTKIKFGNVKPCQGKWLSSSIIEFTKNYENNLMWQKENLSTCTECLHFNSLYIVFLYWSLLECFC